MWHQSSPPYWQKAALQFWSDCSSELQVFYTGCEEPAALCSILWKEKHSFSYHVHFKFYFTHLWRCKNTELRILVKWVWSRKPTASLCGTEYFHLLLSYSLDVSTSSHHRSYSLLCIIPAASVNDLVTFFKFLWVDVLKENLWWTVSCKRPSISL